MVAFLLTFLCSLLIHGLAIQSLLGDTAACLSCGNVSQCQFQVTVRPTVAGTWGICGVACFYAAAVVHEADSSQKIYYHPIPDTQAFHNFNCLQGLSLHLCHLLSHILP